MNSVLRMTDISSFSPSLQTLVTLPAEMTGFINSQGAEPMRERLAGPHGNRVFVDSDPAGRQLGSGGGTVNLLHRVWQQTRDPSDDLASWVASGKRLVIHAGGEGRRMPAYAPIGKLFLPMPVVLEGSAQRFDQMLCDHQVPLYTQALIEAGSTIVAMVTAGDVWLKFNPLDVCDVQSDICGIGIRVPPETAQHFGVFFVSKANYEGTGRELPISSFLQKPTPNGIRRRQQDNEFFVDTGMWLFSARALMSLFRICGWDDDSESFATPGGVPASLDLYDEVGRALGHENEMSTRLSRSGFSELSTSMIPLEQSTFHHVGTGRQLFDLLAALCPHSPSAARQYFVASSKTVLDDRSGAPVWVDRVASGRALIAAGTNLITGLPAESTIRALAEQICLDVVPLRDGALCFRPYHVDDSWEGTVDEGGRICGIDAAKWLSLRGLDDWKGPVFDLPIYPRLPASQMSQVWLDWFFHESPNPTFSKDFVELTRCSGRELLSSVDCQVLSQQRQAGFLRLLDETFKNLIAGCDLKPLGTDYGALAEFISSRCGELSRWLQQNQLELRERLGLPLLQARFDHFLAGLSHGSRSKSYQRRGIDTLQKYIIRQSDLPSVQPRAGVKKDQIVWARSPVRLDLAGGWTDTPPHCLRHGGLVLNVAVHLNGQPPIQVLGRLTESLDLRIRSIDLGESCLVHHYQQLTEDLGPESVFGIPKTVLSIAGFHPDFCVGSAYSCLADQLQYFGGGIELSLLCAVPKGSGLGTSSILAATILGALRRMCGLDWDYFDILRRVLAIEQLLTTGGGWQDQSGAIFPGVKLIETRPGAAQRPAVRYVPERALQVALADDACLLYYTGLTRMAKDILQDIVTNMFLECHHSGFILDMIRRNARQAYDAMVIGNYTDLARAVDRSWRLNKLIDADTSNPAIERIIRQCGDDLFACKLLGAGGGGYLLIFARDGSAGRRIRGRLMANPPNERARFVDCTIAETELEVTVS